MRWLLASLLIIFCAGCDTHPAGSPGAQTDTAASTAPDPATPEPPAYTIEMCLHEMHDADGHQRMSAVMGLTTYFSDEEARTALPTLNRLATEDPESFVRSSAVTMLSQLAPDRLDYLPAFVAALDDEAERVRSAAVEQISRIGPRARSAVPALIRQLLSNEGAAGDLAATALRNIDAAAMLAEVPDLLKQLDQAPQADRAAAAYALGCIGPFTTINTDSTDWASLECYRPARLPGGIKFSTMRSIKASLPPVSGELDPRVRDVPAALENALMGDYSRVVRLKVIRSLGHYQQYARGSVDRLGSFLADDDPEIRMAAIGALAEIGPGGGALVDDLVNALADPEEAVVIEALRALQNWDGDRTPALPGLKEIVAATSMQRSWGPEVGAVLRALGPEAAPVVPELVTYLTDHVDYLDPAYAEGLGYIGPAAKAAIPALINLIEVNSTAAPFAAISLAQIDPGGRRVLPALRTGLLAGNTASTGCAVALGNLAKLPDAAVADLVAGLQISMGTDTACCKALSNKAAQSPQVIPALAAALGTEGPVPSAFAGLALIQNGEAFPELVPDIIMALQRQRLMEDHRGGLVAGWLIANDDAAVAHLLRALHHDDGHGYYAGLAAQGLAARGAAAQAAVPDLQAALDSSVSGMPLVAAYALTQIEPEALAEFIPQLVDWLYVTACEFRLNVIWVLGEAGAVAEPALPDLRIKLNDPEEATRIAAALAIARIEEAIAGQSESDNLAPPM